MRGAAMQVTGQVLGATALCEHADMSAPDHEPSPRLAAALDAFDAASVAYDEARDELRAAIAEELKARDVSVPRLTKVLPWSEEIVRRIAREAKVPRLREPTVRS